MKVTLRDTPLEYNLVEIEKLINQNPEVTAGEEYYVYGLSYIRSKLSTDSNYFSSMYFDIMDDTGSLLSIPHHLWRVTDASIPTQWVMRQDDNGTFVMEPALFSQDYFVDRLTDYEPEAMEQFKKLKVEMYGKDETKK